MTGLLRRAALAGTTGVAALALLTGAAHADTSSTLSVVGTSDVSDSGLMPNLIQPEFEAAYPQFAYKYTGSATGVAIQAAEAPGSSTSPSVLIVHAASLENQFVKAGYSNGGAYGNAIFRNDFVLAGPASNEASKGNVLAGASNNAAQAFADVATAGVAGTATYISRGGSTTASGTTVEEHQIWGLVYTAGLLPAGDSANFVLCTVSAADGGGMSPISATVMVGGAPIAAGAACPDSGTVASTDAPSWYVVNTVSQAASVEATNACTVGNANGSCYALTDRGTFDYLSSGGTATAGPSVIPNLQIVTRDNSQAAPGGRYELINYFHAYIVSPNGPNSGEPNLTAAQDFISFLTSPTFQSQLSGYLSKSGDPDGSPFVADASPIITAAGLPSAVAPGTAVTVSGNVANAEVGFPTLAAEPVSVEEVDSGLDVPISGATATTDSNGNYSVTFTPPSTGSYQVVTGQISQIENPALTPIYGDILSPGASTASSITVAAPAAPAAPAATPTVTTAAPTPTPGAASVVIKSTTGGVGIAKVTGTLSPAVPGANGHIAILAHKAGTTGAYTEVGGFALRAGQTSFSANAALAAGTWQLEAYYTDPGALAAATSKAEDVTVHGATTSAAITRASAKTGKLTLSGKLSQTAPATATVELLGVETAHLSGAKLAKVGSFKTLAKVTVKAGKVSFTLSAKLTRGYRYNLQLAYVQKGKATTYSKLTSLSVG